MSRGEYLGYTTMVLAFLLVYFGIRSYRDNEAGGTIGFVRAFQVGILITIVACVCYVATWEFIYYRMDNGFSQKYAEYAIAAEKAKGATPAALEAKRQEMAHFQEMYQNPVYNSAITFMEPFPVGLVITLVCAGVLSRRRASVHPRPEMA